MNARVLSPRIVGFFALSLWLGACGGSSNPPSNTGTAGAGSAGAGSAGVNGSAGAGSAGAGTAGAGTAGAGTAGAGTAGAGTAGAGTAGAGTAGAGTAGVGAAGAGTAGAGTAGTGSGGATTMSEPSMGCNVAPASTDSATAWVKHDVDVTGVDAAFISAHPVNAGGTYTWTHRNYFIRLPTSYDITKAYPVAIGGSGCGGPDIVGQEGGYSVLGLTAGETQGIQVAMSYVPSNAVNSCAGFADDFTNSPEPPYIHAMIADIEGEVLRRQVEDLPLGLQQRRVASHAVGLHEQRRAARLRRADRWRASPAAPGVQAEPDRRDLRRGSAGHVEPDRSAHDAE